MYTFNYRDDSRQLQINHYSDSNTYTIQSACEHMNHKLSEKLEHGFDLAK